MTEVSINYGETAYGPVQVSSTQDNVPQYNSIALTCFPNPFNPRITIDLDLSKAGTISSTTEVMIEVFDLRGRKVRTLHNGILPEGKRHGMTWDGQDDSGRGLSSGIYLVQARVGDKKARQKITLLR